MLPGDLMNAEDVARYLHVGKNTVYQLAKSGQLASYHAGRKLRFALEDIEAYIASTHRVGVETEVETPAAADDLACAASLGELPVTPFVIAGGDVAADMVASALNAAGTPATRLMRNSYASLVNLYAGDADAAVVHLYDQRSNSCNVPYVCNLVPGVSVVVFRLYGREQGLIVREGNPRHLATWGSLLREGVRISNRQKGSGARVLLDEKLRAMDAWSESLEGYDRCAPTASTAVKRVASGAADAAIGTSREANGVKGVEFVPLQKEWVDLVAVKTPASRPRIRQLKSLLASEGFRETLGVLTPCDLSKLGSIAYES